MAGQARGRWRVQDLSILVVLTDDADGRALPVWLNGPEGHACSGAAMMITPTESAEMITVDLLDAAGVTVTGVDIDELDPR